jgi:hypothetical protein
MFRLILCFILLFSSLNLQAQDNGNQGQDSTVVEKYGPSRQISTIVYMGLAGAVLGLSTLSFYGRPQDKLSNIPIGFGVGVVIGTIYMTYQAATDPDEFYRQSDYNYRPDLNEPLVQDLMVSDLIPQEQPIQFSYEWTF